MKDTRYTAYLIRMWQASEQGDWRFSVENVHTGEKTLFANYKRLMHFLQPAEPPDSAGGWCDQSNKVD